MADTLGAIQKALDDRLIVYAGTELAWEGRAFTPVEGMPYLATQMVSRDRFPAGVGRNAVVRWIGTYQVNVVIPSGDGVYTPNSKASEIVDHFPRGLTLSTAGGTEVTIENVRTPPALHQAGWVVLPVQIQWFANEFPSA